MTLTQLRAGPSPRPGTSPAADDPGRHPPRRSADSGYAHRDAQAWAIPLRTGRRRAGPGPAPARPRTPGNPPRRHHRQRQPLLPGHAHHIAAPRPAGPRRHPAGNRRARRPGRRARPAQARPNHHRRPRRLPPGHLPRRHRQDPMPAPPGLDDTQPATGPRSSPRPKTRPPAAPSRPSPSRPQVAAKTRQKHDYPSPAHRRSYARRTGAERTFATLKDPATTSIARGWCRLTGPTPLTLWLACLLAVRNQRILDAWHARQARDARRAAAGLPPKTQAPPPQNPRQPRRRPAITGPSPAIFRAPARRASTSRPARASPRNPSPAPETSQAPPIQPPAAADCQTQM